MRILITTLLHDVHAVAVALALRDRGHVVDLHHGADFPSRQLQSFGIGSGAAPFVRVRDDASDYGFQAPDVVWNRRPTRGAEPAALHPADRAFARRESQHLANSVWALAAPDAFWINPRASAVRARLKPVQLCAARDAGFAVPDTLVSNDPVAIRAFLRAHGTVAYKPMMSANWIDERGGQLALYTKRITEADLPGDDALALCPGIFQRFVAKRHELRVTVMGNSLFTLKLDSAAHALAQDDWRRAQCLGLDATRAELPGAVAERCLEVMRRLGLVYGCIDLIVDERGEYVFLEVNEMGQFLFNEVMAPAMPMLDAFVRFCESGNPQFVHREQAGGRVELAALLARAQVQMDAEACVHCPPAPWTTSDERDPHAGAPAAAAA